MLLLTLEGLPHSGRAAVLKLLARQQPGWLFIAVEQTQSPWLALVKKIQGLAKAKGKIVVLSAPWFESVPQHPAVARLVKRMTLELVGLFGVVLDAHVMIHLKASHHESFEQMVGLANPHHNLTTLEDMSSQQNIIAHELLAAPKDHPFPPNTFTIHCPAFYDDNELTIRDVAQQVQDIVSMVLEGMVLEGTEV